MSDLIGAAPQPAAGAYIKDATIETFQDDVLTASLSTPVVVDFWATWCGPCKQLTPVLEKVVNAAGGAVRLVKVDIDKNQMLASQLRIQSVPTVFAFFQGQPVDAFQGALPESEVRAFIERLVQMAGGAAGAGPEGGPSAADVEQVLAEAEQALQAGDAAGAAQLFAAVGQVEGLDEALTARALAGLARCRLALGDVAQARQTAEMIPEAQRGEAAVASVFASLELAEEAGADAGDVAALAAAAERAPEDLDARFRLAGARLAAGDAEAALDDLFAVVERDRDWNEGAARQKVLKIFEALGPTNPTTVRGRRRLSSILFA